MTKTSDLEIIKQGVPAWNAWTQFHAEGRPIGSPTPDLDGVNLEGAHLVGIDLGYARLRGANLRGANLAHANLHAAQLEGALLDGACLSNCDFLASNLRGASLKGASLGCANFVSLWLKGADIEGAALSQTLFIDVDLSTTKGLQNCQHHNRSYVDHRTIQRSKNVPLAFWRGCGLPDQLIEYMPSLSGDAIQFYSSFISYSSKDQEFADRLHADLQNAGVRCWFAPHDLPIGDDTRETIDAQIRVREKVILILSEASVASAWVSREVKTALEEEKKGRRVLFPIRVDEAVMDTTEQWAHDIRRARNIGDFTNWKDHDAYMKTLERILRDLRAEC